MVPRSEDKMKGPDSKSTARNRVCSSCAYINLMLSGKYIFLLYLWLFSRIVHFETSLSGNQNNLQHQILHYRVKQKIHAIARSEETHDLFNYWKNE